MTHIRAHAHAASLHGKSNTGDVSVSDDLPHHGRRPIQYQYFVLRAHSEFGNRLCSS